MVREDYFRCGSCSLFEEANRDRMGRTSGQCPHRPRWGQIAAHDYACQHYRVDRARLVPGAKVPEDADLSPAERSRRDELASAQQRAHLPAARRPAARPAPPAAAAPTRRRPQTIPLGGEGEQGMDREELKAILAEVLDEALGVSDPPLQRRFRGGKVVITPADPELSAHELEIDVLLRKVTAVRDKLRVLEQKINASEGLDPEERATIQGYVTSCYGSLKSFNFLFADRGDWFGA